MEALHLAVRGLQREMDGLWRVEAERSRALEHDWMEITDLRHRVRDLETKSAETRGVLAAVLDRLGRLEANGPGVKRFELMAPIVLVALALLYRKMGGDPQALLSVIK